jgi:prophage tail gpP-like protein
MVGISGTKRKRKGDLADYKNPLLRRDGFIRPSAFRIANGDKDEAYTIAKGRIGRMFANAASWTLPNIASWKDPQGNFWQRNTTITVLAENLMIYRETEFLIREVTFDATEQSRSTTLGLVLPEVFADEATPEFWPWDD